MSPRQDPSPESHRLAFQQLLPVSVHEEVRVAAKSNRTVLLVGDTGTGKSLCAKAIHLLSARADRAFQFLECTTVTEHLFESELFGHERGAFTGAVASKPGITEAADRGTLFLDEIDDIPLPQQGKLLRLLEEGVIRRVGDWKDTPLDLRIICAAKTDLDEMVRSGAFRADLLYRLRRKKILLPSLRERPNDIARIACFMLRLIDKAGRISNGSRPADFEAEVFPALEAYRWPGNLRELEACVEDAHERAEGDTITLDHLRDYIVHHESPGLRSDAVAGGSSYGGGKHGGRYTSPAGGPDVERDNIIDAFRQTGGDKTATCKLLRMKSRTTLYERIERYGITEDDWKS